MSVILEKTIAEYVAAQRITARVTSAAPGVTTDRDGWAHRAYRVQLTWGGTGRAHELNASPRVATFAWSLGTGHPAMTRGEVIDAAPLFDALLSEYSTAVEYGALDADGDVTRAGDALDFARDYGYAVDTRADHLAASRLLARMGVQSARLVELAGGVDALDVALPLERL